MPDVKEVINGLEMSYKYSNVDENNTLVPQWIVLHALALLKAQEPRVMVGAELTDTELIEAIRKAPITLKPAVDAVPVEWLDAQIRGYASALKSTELKALVLVKQMWQKEQEADIAQKLGIEPKEG